MLENGGHSNQCLHIHPGLPAPPALWGPNFPFFLFFPPRKSSFCPTSLWQVETIKAALVQCRSARLQCSLTTLHFFVFHCQLHISRRFELSNTGWGCEVERWGRGLEGHNGALVKVSH